ncbi:hypothetical protein LAZ67_17001706 [Cordylochernes scorpioides]|uniref:Reverse transcriptase domain-containing protein n=1 Tax=Cordylochernes scorpioides TaxID=51811 RepID=A0ABY6LDK7_9ARAC|nr:hypothetical protein LAZ67_17001706 [Cordylochernes scorpioides]
MYGLPKTHKPETPLRPIVAFFSSPTALHSKFIANFLKPFIQLQNSPFPITSTQTFIGEVLKIKPESDRNMVSFDVQSLYPSLPHPLIIRDTIELLQEQHIDTDIIHKITQLITLCLNNCIFAYNSKSYRQAKGSSMGSPLSTTIAEISMRSIDRWITARFPHDIVFWRRYIDDIFCICTTTQTENILCNLNNYHPDLHFTVEKENNNTLPFLDINIIRYQHELHTTVYYKPSFRPNYVPYSSFCPISHKINTVIALSKRVHTHCSLRKYKNLETQNIIANLKNCAYPIPLYSKFLHQNQVGVKLNEKLPTNLGIFKKMYQNYITLNVTHYEQHKSKYDTYEGLMRQEKLKEFKLGMKNNISQESEAAVHPSYFLSEMITKHSKPFTEGDFIKECLIKAEEIVCPGSVKTFQAISLSRNTVVERVTDMARNSNDQIKEKSSCFEAFSIACNESTACDTDFNIFEELLELVPMHGTTTGEYIFNCVYDLLQKYNSPQSKLTSVATDGAPSMTGKTNGFVALLRKKTK